MATEQKLESISMLAAADLSTKQFYFVKVSAANTVNLAGNGEAAIGVLQDKPAAASRSCQVGIEGISKCVAGGVIAAGDFISADANGKAAVPLTGEYILGIALTAASADGVVFDCLLNKYGRAP